MRVEGRKTLFSTLVDCAKGFLTAEDRDQMANLIRPNQAPLLPVTSTVTPVVTTIRDMPLNAVSQLPVTATPASLTVTTIAAVVTTVITPVTTTTPAVVMTTAITPVTPAVSIDVTPQGGAVSSTQKITTPMGEAAGAITTVAVSEVPATPQVPSTIAFHVIPSIPGTFPSNSQSQPAVGTFTTLSGSTCPVSHPKIIQPSDQRPPPRVIVGVEGLTLPSDPAAMVTVTVARLMDPLGSHTLLQGLASHQAASATSHVGVSTAPTVIGTIHGPGVPRHIATVGGSVEPVVSASTSHEGESNIFMVVEDDDKIVEVGMAQGFTKIMEPKKEKVDPPHASRGRGIGGGASQGRPPRGGGGGVDTLLVQRTSGRVRLHTKDKDKAFPISCSKTKFPIPLLKKALEGAEQQRATPKDLPGEDWPQKIKTILRRMELDSRLDAYAELVGRYARNSVSLEHAHMVSRGSTDGYYEVAKYEI